LNSATKFPNSDVKTYKVNVPVVEDEIWKFCDNDDDDNDDEKEVTEEEKEEVQNDGENNDDNESITGNLGNLAGNSRSHSILSSQQPNQSSINSFMSSISKQHERAQQEMEIENNAPGDLSDAQIINMLSKDFMKYIEGKNLEEITPHELFYHLEAKRPNINLLDYTPKVLDSTLVFCQSFGKLQRNFYNK